MKSWPWLTGSVVLAAVTSGSAETRTVAAGPQYGAGGAHQLFFGADYRRLWTTPIEVEVLDLGSFASGLTPVRRVGGMQTKSLALRGGDGRAYTFRSLDKDPSGALPVDLQGTIATSIIRDQTAGAHPGGPIVAAGLLQAAGVRAAQPRMVILPDDPALGEFRGDFAGVLGTIEEFAMPGFEGATEVMSANDARTRFETSPEDRPDARAFLRVRLVDLLIGDWDRHRNQWRWLRLPNEPLWHPVPEDRDQAFARYEGVLPSLARHSLPKILVFGPRYPNLEGLTFNGAEHDRAILSALEWSEWEPIVADVKRRITDEVIDVSIARMPAPYVTIDGPRLRHALRARRDHLDDVARRFYRRLAKEVDFRLTDAPEEVEVVHNADRTLDVSVRAASATAPYLRRRLRHGETQEVRVYLRGGTDHVKTRGPRGPILVRVVGGQGKDVVDDSASGGTRFSDPDGRLIAGDGSHHDDRLYTPPVDPRAPLDPPRDWGKWTVPIVWVAGSPDIGTFLGGGFVQRRYGFRKDPFSTHHLVRAGWATGAKRGRAEYRGLFHREGSGTRLGLAARASGIEILRFHGFGNETQADGPNEFYKAAQQQYTLEPSLTFTIGPRVGLSIGPVAQFATTDLAADRFIGLTRPYGSDDFGQAGARVRVAWDSRNSATLPERGLFAAVEARTFPAAWDVEESFTDLHGEVSTVMTAGGRVGLALRAGGKHVFGLYPFHEAAFLGGADTVRGFTPQRFAGDSAVWGNAELRLFLTRFFFLVPGELGVFGLSDAGRVFLEGESSDRWHTSVGGGLWVSVLSRRQTMSLAVARSRERTAVYLRGGLSF
jgi:hypothetical protein